MANFGLFIRFTLQEGAGEAFDALMSETTAGIRANEPGTLVYACSKVDGAPNQRIFFELYEDEEAFEEHERQPITRHFLTERSKYVEKTEADRLAPYTGKYPTKAVANSEIVTVGQRVKELRHASGMSLSDLATAVGRSESWVSQVERGIQSVQGVTILQVLADALGVSVREVCPDSASTSVPVEAGTDPERTHLDAVRVALTGHPALGSLFNGPQPGRTPSLADLRLQVGEAWRLAHASRYAALSDQLAHLLPGIEAAGRHATASERSEFHALQARAYQVAAASLTRQDEPDAAWVAADRALQAAELAGQPLEVVAGLFRMAHAFMRQQHIEQADQVARTAVAVIAPRAKSPTCPPEELSLLGAMNLVLAVINAREGDRAGTQQHIKQAREIAARLGEDRNDFDTEFGPTNVEIHAVSTALELGDAGLALEAAQQIDPSGLSPERQARFLLDVARAHAQRRNVGEAAAALLEAEALAPEQVHDHHVARDVIRELIQLSGRRIPHALEALAQRSAVA